MQKEKNDLKKKAREILDSKKAVRVIGWSQGNCPRDVSPFVFNNSSELETFVFGQYCGSNLTKLLLKESKKEGKSAVILKPCERYNLNQLIKEKKINPEKIYIIETDCDGMKDPGKELSQPESGEDELLLEKCKSCKDRNGSEERFSEVISLENMSQQEKLDFWNEEFSECIRCNACKNSCPLCSCTKCLFENDSTKFSGKVHSGKEDAFAYHIIRAFHVAGRCTDCGECSRACLQGVPVNLLNRKVIKDINEFYGEYIAGEDTESINPLTCYGYEDPEAAEDKGEKRDG